MNNPSDTTSRMVIRSRDWTNPSDLTDGASVRIRASLWEQVPSSLLCALTSDESAHIVSERESGTDPWPDRKPRDNGSNLNKDNFCLLTHQTSFKQ